LKQPIDETSRHRGRHADECQRHDLELRRRNAAANTG